MSFLGDLYEDSSRFSDYTSFGVRYNCRDLWAATLYRERGTENAFSQVDAVLRLIRLKFSLLSSPTSVIRDTTLSVIEVLDNGAKSGTSTKDARVVLSESSF